MKLSTKRCVSRQSSRVTAPYLRHYRKCRPFVPLIAMHKYIGKWSTFLFYSGSILIRTKGSFTKLIDTVESILLGNISFLSSWVTYYWWEEDINVDIVDGQPIGTAWDRWNVAEREMGVGWGGRLEGWGWYFDICNWRGAHSVVASVPTRVPHVRIATVHSRNQSHTKEPNNNDPLWQWRCLHIVIIISDNTFKV